MSPFINTANNSFHTQRHTHTQHLPSSCLGQGIFDQMTEGSNTNQMPTTSSDSHSCSSAGDHCQESLSKFALLQPLIALPVQVVSFHFTSERCDGVGGRGAAGVRLWAIQYVGVGGEVPPLQWRSPRPPSLIHSSCGHLRPIKSH